MYNGNRVFAACSSDRSSDGRAATPKGVRPVDHGLPVEDLPRIFAFLIIATMLEAFGDAIVRLGINEAACMPRCALFLAGAFLLFGYGFSLNLAPIEFGRLAGLYIATLFVVWQIVNLMVFKTTPEMPVLFGGSLIVAGGFVVTFWR